MKVVLDTTQDIWELFEDITRLCLVDSYHTNEEVGDDPKVSKALLKIIKYYSTPDQWKQFKEENLK
jgi:hypothetical protein